MSVKVTLDEVEVQHAILVGVNRQLAAIKRERPDYHGYEGAGWDLHIEGAAAELALAKHYQRYWTAFADEPHKLEGDVGRVQVRQTLRADGCLITHKKDPDEAAFVLVTGRLPEFVLVGWRYGHETKRDEWWRSNVRSPAFFVPQRALKSVPPRQPVSS